MRKRICVVMIVLMALFFTAPLLAQQNWLEVKDDHFQVKFNLEQDRLLAGRILNEAEKYYDSVGDLIGYTKYHDFWTWDDRVNIILYPDKWSFTQFTGQPNWSRGYAAEHSRLFSSKSIVTYKQEALFEEDILPHEVSHLVLRDYIGFSANVIPLWLDEGVAQLQQQSRQKPVKKFMKEVVRQGAHIPFDQIMSLDIRSVKDGKRVSIFYGQSLSMVQFMLTKYGRSNFQRLFREIKNGVSFNNALKKVYRIYFRNTQDFEDKWLRYVRNQL